jgi:5-keto 4-deoxyuronate isomerase
MIIDNVTNIRGVVRIGDDDVTNVERDAYEATYGENEVAFNSIIVFDESEFILESGTSDRYRDIKSAQDELKRRTKDINSFLKSKKRQMDIRRWQK